MFPTSIARPWAWFYFAIKLLSSVGVCLNIIQSVVTSKCIMGFQAADCHRCRVQAALSYVYSWKAEGLFHLWTIYNNLFMVGEKWKTTTTTTTTKTAQQWYWIQKWLEIVTGEDLPTKLPQEWEHRLAKFRIQKLPWSEVCEKAAATKYYNYTANKTDDERGQSDCQHFNKIWSIEFATKLIRRGNWKDTVKIIFFDANDKLNLTLLWPLLIYVVQTQ